MFEKSNVKSLPITHLSLISYLPFKFLINQNFKPLNPKNCSYNNLAKSLNKVHTQLMGDDNQDEDNNITSQI